MKNFPSANVQWKGVWNKDLQQNERFEKVPVSGALTTVFLVPVPIVSGLLFLLFLNVFVLICIFKNDLIKGIIITIKPFFISIHIKLNLEITNTANYIKNVCLGHGSSSDIGFLQQFP